MHLQEFDLCEFLYIAFNFNHYIFRTVYIINTISLCENIFWCLAQVQCQRHEV